MDRIEDGGPAFPIHPIFIVPKEHYLRGGFESAEGMTLRSYFAAAALKGILAAQDSNDMGHFYDESGCDRAAYHAVRFADALLAALRPGQKKPAGGEKTLGGESHGNE